MSEAKGWVITFVQWVEPYCAVFLDVCVCVRESVRACMDKQKQDEVPFDMYVWKTNSSAVNLVIMFIHKVLVNPLYNTSTIVFSLVV